MEKTQENKDINVNNRVIPSDDGAIVAKRCPKCGSTALYKVGFLGCKANGKRQRYRCKECFTSFY
jgi:transposase-like protein